MINVELNNLYYLEGIDKGYDQYTDIIISAKNEKECLYIIIKFQDENKCISCPHYNIEEIGYTDRPSGIIKKFFYAG